VTPEWRTAFLAGYESGLDLVGYDTHTASLEDNLDDLADHAYREHQAFQSDQPADRSLWALERMGPPEGWLIPKLKRKKTKK
jgi:hypothetical protein